MATITCLAVSIGWRTYLQYTSDSSYYFRERKREQWELENFPAGEVTEMIELCESMGVAHHDATISMTALAKYERFFVDLMMVLELRMQMPDYDPVVNAVASAGAFALFGCMPCAALVLYSHAFHAVPESWALFGPAFACATGLLSSLLLAGVKSRLLPHRSAAWACAIACAAGVTTIGTAYLAAPALRAAFSLLAV
jgi:DNA damage-binding protein 1